MNRYINSDIANFWEYIIKTTYVTLHLIKYPVDGVVQLGDLEKVHPGITKNVNHGDIIENCDFHGYRSDGLSMVYIGSDNKKQVINIGCGDFSDCNPNTQFKIFKDFVPSHWNLNKSKIITYKGGLESEAYWHDDGPVIELSLNKYPELKIIFSRILMIKKKSPIQFKKMIYCLLF